MKMTTKEMNMFEKKSYAFKKLSKKDLFWLCISLLQEHHIECQDIEKCFDYMIHYKDTITLR